MVAPAARQRARFRRHPGESYAVVTPECHDRVSARHCGGPCTERHLRSCWSVPAPSAMWTSSCRWPRDTLTPPAQSLLASGPLAPSTVRDGGRRSDDREGVIEHLPAVHIRRPRIDYESHVAHLDRNELGAILVTAGLSSPRDHALVSLLALNGLRVSEAIGTNRGLRSGTRAPHPDRAAEGRQARHHATRPESRPSN
jgi:hypothetical protein